MKRFSIYLLVLLASVLLASHGLTREERQADAAGSATLDYNVAVPWADTGIDAVAGEAISVTASGSATYDWGHGDHYIGPGGDGGAAGWGNCSVHGLVGWIGSSRPGAATFPLSGVMCFGASYSGSAPASGRLYISMNDYSGDPYVFTDNAGTWHVQITVGNPPNQPPTGVNAYGPYLANKGQFIQFQSAAIDPDGDPITFSWDFGDKTIGTGSSPLKAYANRGRYFVHLTVTDSHGASAHAYTYAFIGCSSFKDCPSPSGYTAGVTADVSQNIQLYTLPGGRRGFALYFIIWDALGNMENARGTINEYVYSQSFNLPSGCYRAVVAAVQMEEGIAPRKAQLVDPAKLKPSDVNFDQQYFLPHFGYTDFMVSGSATTVSVNVPQGGPDPGSVPTCNW